MAFVRTGQLDAGDELHLARVGVRFGLEVGGEVVVIADGEDLDAGRACHVDHFARRARAVGVIGVCVQVCESHAAQFMLRA